MIAIIDYQMGNLRSVQKGFERVGHEARVSSDPAEVAGAAKLVLPGVGAFGDAMHELFQLDSQGNVPLMFGDMGTGHLFQCDAHRSRVAFTWACG